MSPPGGSEQEPAVQPRSMRHNALLTLISQLIGASATAVLTLFLARRLGATGYGILALALGLGGLALLPSDFGITNSVARFVAEHRGDPARGRGILADGLRLKALAALAVSAVLFALAQPIADAYGIRGLMWPLRVVALALFGESLMMTSAVLVAAGRADLQLRVGLLESVIEPTTVITLVLCGLGATGATLGRAAGYLAAAALTMFMLRRVFGREALPTNLRFGPETRRIVTYASVLLVVDGAYTMFSQIDVLIIGAYGGAAAAGFFSAPVRLVTFLAYPSSSVAAAVAPRLARTENGTPDPAPFIVALRVLLVVQAFLTAFVVGWAHLMVKVTLGDHFRPSVAVLLLLSPYVFLLGFGTFVSIVVNYLGEARRRIPIAVATVAINVALDILLVPSLGARGGAIGTDVAYALYAPAHLVLCWRALELDLRSTLLSLIRTTLAGTGLAATLLLFGDSTAHLARTLAGGVVATAVFIGTLWLTREVTLLDARRWVASLRGRGAPG